MCVFRRKKQESEREFEKKEQKVKKPFVVSGPSFGIYLVPNSTKLSNKTLDKLNTYTPKCASVKEMT